MTLLLTTNRDVGILHRDYYFIDLEPHTSS